MSPPSHRAHHKPQPFTTDMKPNKYPALHPLMGACRFRSPGWQFLPLTFCLGAPFVALADTTDFLPNAGLDPQGLTTPYSGPMLVTPFKYIAPPGAKQNQPEELELPKRSPDQQRIVDLNAASNYQAVGTEGLALISREKPDDALQLIIANSLAWTGRLKEAIPTYQVLTNGKYANEANLGMANAHRWDGRDDQAMPLYQKVLAIDPGNADALEGAEMATRELVPRTTLSFGGSSDSSETQRRFATINHRWRDRSGANIMEIETSRVRDWLPNSEAQQQDVSARYEALNLALKPSLELSMPTGDGRTLYGRVRVKLLDDQVSLTIGRVNWGRMAINPNALSSRLAASHVGMSATQGFSFGILYGRADYYDISDNNQILTSRLQLASNWRPFGNNFKPYIGIETRDAKFNTPNYWSPDQGSGTAYAGVLGEWGSADWNFYASGQSGIRLYGDAGTNWSVSAGGKRWLSNDVALSMNLWSMASWRDNAAYRAQSATINLEKLWR